MASMSNVAATHLIVGPEEFLAQRALTSIRDAVRQATGNPTLPVESFKANEVDAGIIRELLSPSLFAESRLIHLHGVEDCSKELIDLINDVLEDPLPDMVVVVTHKASGRNKKYSNSWAKLVQQVHEAPQLNPRDRQQFVLNEFRSFGVRVSPEIVTVVLDAVGSDLRELATAVSQLVSDTGGRVDVEAVRRYYGGRAEVSGFEIADLIVTGQTAQALALTRRALQIGESPVKIFSAVIRAVDGLAQVVGAGRIDPRRQAAQFGMAPWQLEKLIKQARSWNPAMIAQAVQITADLEAAMKGASVDVGFALERGVKDLGALHRR